MDDYNAICLLLFVCKIRFIKITVLTTENKTDPPQLQSGCDGGKVASSHVVHLTCPTPSAVIYYTTDGIAPHLHSTKLQVFLL